MKINVLIEQIDNFLLEAKIDNHIKKFPDRFAERLYRFNKINPKYIDWIFSELKELVNRSRGDIDLVIKGATSWDTIKNIQEKLAIFEDLIKYRIIDGADKDIMRYTYFGVGNKPNRLYNLPGEHYTELDRAKKRSEFRKKIKEKPDFKIIYEDDSYRIIKVNNVSAACRLPHGDWCTATRSEYNMFDYYNKDSDGLYYIEKIGQGSNVAVRTNAFNFTVTTQHNNETEINNNDFIKNISPNPDEYHIFIAKCTIPPWVVEEILTYEGKM